MGALTECFACLQSAVGGMAADADDDDDDDVPELEVRTSLVLSARVESCVRVSPCLVRHAGTPLCIACIQYSKAVTPSHLCV